MSAGIRNWLILFACGIIGSRSKSQTVVIADPGVISFDITTLADVPVNANLLYKIVSINSNSVC